MLPQALILLGGSASAARLWGVSPGLWEVTNQFLCIRAVGAPVTVLLLVVQVRAASARVAPCVKREDCVRMFPA